MQAVDAVLVPAGGKADTPAGMRTGSTTRYDAPERAFARARKLARCKRPSRPESRNGTTDRCLQSQSRPIPAVANGTSAITKSTGANAVPRPTGMRTLLIVDLVACLNSWFPHQAVATALSGCMRRAPRRARHPHFDFGRRVSRPTRRSGAACQVGVRVFLPRPCLPFRAREKDPNSNLRLLSS